MPPSPVTHSSMGRLTVDQRKQLGNLAKSGKRTYDSLSKQFKVSPQTVKHWEHVARTTKVFTDAARPGRPPKVSPPQRRQVRSLAKSSYSSEQIAKRLSSRSGQQISRTTVGRVLKHSKRPLEWQPVNRGKRLSKNNKDKRLVWCGQHTSAQTGAWLYGDSKYIYIYEAGPNSTSHRWVDPVSDPDPKTGDLLFVLHFYGLVGKDFKSKLIFVPPTPPGRSHARKADESFKSKHFCGVAKQWQDAISSSDSVSNRYKVVLDSASQHTSHMSKRQVQQLGLPLVSDFPPQSWDLNIIEYVWGVLDTKLCSRHGRAPETPFGWQKRVVPAWDEIDQRTINKIVARVRPNIAAVAAKGGAWLSAKKC